jgi:type I restriction enzyme S subunit
MELGMPIMQKDNTLTLEEWVEKPLKQIAPLQRGFDLPSTQLSSGTYPVVYSNGIVNYHNKYMVKAPGIVTGRSGTIGKVTYVTQDFWPHNTSLWVTNFYGNDSKFIYYLYLFIGLERFSTGSGVPTLNRNDVHDFRIPLPPLHEQQAIAQVLSDTDTLIHSLEKKIAKKKLIKQGVMQALLTPKEGWETVILNNVMKVSRGGSPRPIQDYITSDPKGINWIKIGDTSRLSKYIVSSKEKIIEAGVFNSRKVYKGDFLLSNSMSFGRPYILKIDGCIHDGWLVLQEYEKEFNIDFLYYTLTSKHIYNQYLSKAAGSGVLNLNKELVKTIELNKPIDIEEQERIATILSNIDGEIVHLEEERIKYQTLKEGMMQQLLTGKIRLV